MAASSSNFFSSPSLGRTGSHLGGSGAGQGAGSGSGGVNRETLKGLQDVVWSDDEVGYFSEAGQVRVVEEESWMDLEGVEGLVGRSDGWMGWRRVGGDLRE